MLEKEWKCEFVICRFTQKSLIGIESVEVPLNELTHDRSKTGIGFFDYEMIEDWGSPLFWKFF